ncbi:MAG: hemerythrin family protein [Spirochaetes bacterium]|nr:hemerythrin family protein [Spirochaetota bacterium]
MALIHWSKSLETGVETIDIQHKRLLDLLNNVHEVMVEGRDFSELDDIFKKLLDYTDFHFRHEEELFDRNNFPFASGHRKEHARLKKEVLNRMEGYRAGNMEAMDLLAFLVDWLQDHIKGVDMSFGNFIKHRN